MPVPPHLTAMKSVTSIGRLGIKAVRAAPVAPKGFFRMPILLKSLVTQQWLRELKRPTQANFAISADGETIHVPDVVMSGRLLGSDLLVGSSRGAGYQEAGATAPPRAIFRYTIR